MHMMLDPSLANLGGNLRNIALPESALLCPVSLCSHFSLLAMFSSYESQLTEACLEAARYTPFSGSSYDRSSKRVTGWRELVEPLRHTSIVIWHNLRVECARPRHAAVSHIVRRTREKYYSATRSVKRNKDEFIRMRFVEALISVNDREFWGEAKQITR